MAITSVGYDGTVDEAQWAAMVSKVGSYEYGIDGAGDLAVTQSAGTRMISIAAGRAWGRGIMDTSDAAAVIQLDAVSTGSRYDLIALRRSWGPANGGPSEIVVLKGTSAKALPSGRQSNPGITDDQPLALVRVQAGTASIPEIIDLRVWGRNGGQLYAKDDLVRSYVNSVGTEICVGTTKWQRIVGANNVAQWVNRGQLNDTGFQQIATGAAPGWALEYIRYRVKNGMVELLVQFSRTGADIEVPGNGDVGNLHIANVPTAAAPTDWWKVLSSGPTGRAATGYVGTDRKIYLAGVTQRFISRGEKFSLGGFYFKN